MQDFVKELAKKHNMDARVVNHIVGHPSRFLRKVVTSDDTRPVRIMHFGIFALKHAMLKVYKTRDKVAYFHNHENELRLIEKEKGFNTDELLKTLDDLLLSENYNEINRLYSAYISVIKRIVKQTKLQRNISS